MTAKGRAEYNAKNNANLKPPAPNPKTKKDEGRKASFCARMAPIAEKSERVVVQEHQCEIGTVEIWKDVRGYEGFYQISNFGRIKSLARFRKEKKTE
jgi:hypothetical protein